ncbi:MAG: hypothetical protein V1809_00085 [Planctomycetota bacterium]
MSPKKRAYGKLRDIIERRGGSMRFLRQGYRYGAWEISLEGKTAIIEATGSQSFPPLDKLYVPVVPHPSTWNDYGELMPDAEQQLRALLNVMGVT